ncbi:MAG: tRNA pseudouridine(55) synthase TruB [Chitinophagales bacterium]|nr:tRNA pseudouridine(55) synthase TruB [Chitinophagales bacterium]
MKKTESIKIPSASYSDFNFEEGEILLIDKPLHWTSTDVVRKIRYATGIKKTGHAGTLDPLASGLLLVCVGRKATAQIDTLQDGDKEYTGTITLGATTPCYDLERPFDAFFDTTGISEADIYAAAHSFLGESMQSVPLFSAIKIDGKRLYETAHKGKTTDTKTRPIRIDAFEVCKIDMPHIHFRIVCNKGTYIRAIAHDFGKRLQNGAHLSSLRRTKSGDYDIAQAWQLDKLINAIKQGRDKSTANNNNPIEP